MEKITYRFSNGLFYPYEFKEAYESTNVWPVANFLDVTASDATKFISATNPVGKQVGIVNGKLGYVDMPKHETLF